MAPTASSSMLNSTFKMTSSMTKMVNTAATSVPEALNASVKSNNSISSSNLRKGNPNAKVDEHGGFSTTKALLLSVFAPRIFSAHKSMLKSDDLDDMEEELLIDAANKAEEDNDEQTQSTLPSVITANSVNNTNTSLITLDDLGETNKKSVEETSSNDDSITKELKVQQQGEELLQVQQGEEEEDDDKTSTKGDGDNDDKQSNCAQEEEEEPEPTAEEKEAIVISDDPDKETAEIKVEELLRIAFRALLNECHLMTMPVYGHLENPAAVVDDPINGTVSWVQVQVIVHPSSLGIVLDRLERIGVGSAFGTFTVFPTEFCRSASPYAEKAAQDNDPENAAAADTSTPAGSLVRGVDTAPSSEEAAKAKEAIDLARQEWKNAATRLRIEQVREQIIEQAELTFDFLALLAVASILAGIGLITDNTVVIVASMLVSPIMGPVLGLTFGTQIKDWPLVRSSLFNESVALLGCVVIGALIAICSSFTPMAEDTWPTEQMSIRGDPTGLLTGIAIAIPSGMGVCLSILGGNTSSLVGVAISASLLPPAVNAGVCFVYSILLQVDAVTSGSGDTAWDYFVIGGISFALTAINIVCIWGAGIVMFEIKEVAPTQKKNAFWSRDIKAARELNENATANGETPPPVNVSIIRNGVKTALNQMNQNPVGVVRFQQPPKRRPQPAGGLDSMFAMHGKRNNTDPSYYGNYGSFGGATMFGTQGNAADEEVDDNVQYVGLEDMGRLLGLDEDDDGEVAIDHTAIGRRVGRGRYI